MFAIAPYLVEVIDDQKQPQDLWKFFSNENLHDVLTQYYTANLRNYQPSIKNSNRMFMVSKLCKGTSTSISGIYQTGQYGFESDIYSTTKKKVAHRRLTDEADMIPFNFSFYMPKNTTLGQRKRGLLLLGRFNTLGVRHLTIPHLQFYFKNRFPEFTLKIDRVVPNIVMETLLKRGSLKTIRLIKKSIPKDIADVFSDGDKDKIQDIELVIHSKQKTVFSDLNFLLNAVTKKTPPSQIITIPSFAQENIKLEIMLDGRLRTVNLGNSGNLSSNMEIEIQPGKNGHPDLQDWLDSSDDLAKEIVTSWGVSGISWKSII